MYASYYQKHKEECKEAQEQIGEEAKYNLETTCPCTHTHGDSTLTIWRTGEKCKCGVTKNPKGETDLILDYTIDSEGMTTPFYKEVFVERVE